MVYSETKSKLEVVVKGIEKAYSYFFSSKPNISLQERDFDTFEVIVNNMFVVTYVQEENDNWNYCLEKIIEYPGTFEYPSETDYEILSLSVNENEIIISLMSNIFEYLKKEWIIDQSIPEIK